MKPAVEGGHRLRWARMERFTLVAPVAHLPAHTKLVTTIEYGQVVVERAVLLMSEQEALKIASGKSLFFVQIVNCSVFSGLMLRVADILGGEYGPIQPAMRDLLEVVQRRTITSQAVKPEDN